MMKVSKRNILALGIFVALGSMGCAKKDETPVTTTGGGGTTTASPGVVTGTATYATAYYTALGTTRPMGVKLVPTGTSFTTAVNGTTIQQTFITASGGSFTFSNVPAGTYSIGCHLDLNNDTNMNENDPIYQYVPNDPQGAGGNVGISSATFTVTAGATLTAPITMGDAYTNSTTTTNPVYGTIAYTGTAVTPSVSAKVFVRMFPHSAHGGTNGLDVTSTQNGTTDQMWGYGASSVKFSFAIPAGTYHLFAFVDVDNSGTFSTGDKYLVYSPSNAAGSNAITASEIVTIAGNGLSSGDLNLGTFSFGDANTK